MGTAIRGSACLTQELTIIKRSKPILDSRIHDVEQGSPRLRMELDRPKTAAADTQRTAQLINCSGYGSGWGYGKARL